MDCGLSAGNACCFSYVLVLDWRSHIVGLHLSYTAASGTHLAPLLKSPIRQGLGLLSSSTIAGGVVAGAASSGTALTPYTDPIVTVIDPLGMG